MPRPWRETATRPILHISTADDKTLQELITPEQIALGGGDDYLLQINSFFAKRGLRAYIRPLGEPNRCLNPWTAVDCDGNLSTFSPELLGLEHKGATIDDFRDPYGVSGSFQDQFLIHLREHQPCVNCGHPVRKLRAAGRGTYVCEKCQPRPRSRRRLR